MNLANVQIGDENKELLALTNAISSTSPEGGLHAGKTVEETSGKMNLAKLMKIADGGLDEYYYYTGSLTFPADMGADNVKHSCAEIVTWILPTKKLTITQAQFDVFGKNNRFGITTPNNNRLIQTGARISGSGSYRRIDDSVSGIDWIDGLISSIMNTGRRALSPSSNPVFVVGRVDHHEVDDHLAEHLTQTGVAALTSVYVTSVISSPPDLGG